MTRATPLPLEERRQAIIEATLPLVADNITSITTKQIAEAAGVAEGTLFRAFGSLNEILEATIIEFLSIDRLLHKLSTVDLGSDLESKTRHTIEFFQQDFSKARKVLAAVHLDHGDGACLRDQFSERIDALVQELSTRFELHRDELSLAPEIFVGLLKTLSLGAAARAPLTKSFDIDTLTRFALDGGRRKDLS